MKMLHTIQDIWVHYFQPLVQYNQNQEPSWVQQRLQQKLAKNLHVDPAQDIFAIEQQIIEKAQAMFDLLKKYEWQRQGKLILFHESAQVRKFNTLYQDVLKLNAQIEKIKNNNVAVLEKEL